MRKKIIKVTAAAALIVGSVAPATMALAASAAISQAKSSCTVGERNDGYLGVVPGATASDAIRRELRSVNQQRKAAYEQLAQRNGVTIEVTAALTAEKLINQAPSGHCVQDGAGDWIKKA